MGCQNESSFDKLVSSIASPSNPQNEGIVPKLVWTKRIETGEVVTAQHWKNGRELTFNEMHEQRVANLLKKIHSLMKVKKIWRILNLIKI